MYLFNIIVLMVSAATVIKAETEATVNDLNGFNFEVEISELEMKTQVQQLIAITDKMDQMLEDIKGCTCSHYYDRTVFYVRGGRYVYNFEDAKRACAERGATLATPEQLEAACKAGMDMCQLGWVSDGSVRFPITNPRKNCGTEPAGVRNWGYYPKDKKGADAYCFRN